MIAHFLSALFPQMEIVERAVFRVTRDADFEVSDEADDLLEAVELELRRRRFGDVVRLEVSAPMSDARCSSGSSAGSASTTRRSTRSTGCSTSPTSRSSLRVDRPELQGRAVARRARRRASRPRIANGDLFAEIRRGDMLVHHPYESFATSVRGVRPRGRERPRRDRR